MITKSFAAAATAVLLCSAASAQQMDGDFASSVKNWTTKPEFMSPLVDHLPASSTIPSPKQVLGQHIGAPNTLHYYEQIISYYRALAAAAPDRVKIIEIGKSEEGRENVVVMISSPANIAKLDTYRQNLGRLADPRQINAAEAADIIAATKPIYHISGGLHSAETGPPEMLMELAYRLLTEDSPLMKSISENLVVSLTPVLEADGRDRYVDWYYRNLIDERDDMNKPGGPPYWGKYIYHDNNRDINFSDVSARELMKFYLDWHPPIMHELHESVPFMYTYSGQAPQNPDLDPILFGELPWFSNFEMAQMTKYGMPGVWTHGFVDAWTPGYLAFMSSNHNGMLRMYETFGNAGATTMLRHVAPEVQSSVRGGDYTKRDWYRPLPPYKEVMWSMRNNTNYMETGVLTALDLASRFPNVILENFYKKSANAVEAGTKDAPYAYIIPAGQADEARLKFVTDVLQMQGIEIGRAGQAIRLKDASYPAGSLVVKLNQPYGRLAKMLLRLQDNYPDEKLMTYDDAAWTMGLMTHTKIVEITDKAVLDVPVTPYAKAVLAGSISAPGAATYAVLDEGSVNMATLRYRLKDVSVRIVDAPMKAGSQTIPAGSFLVPGSAYATLKPQVEELGLKAVSLGRSGSVTAHDGTLPRTAVFSTWGATEKVGWLRYAFDQQDIDYDLIYKERVRQGNLRADFDVIILPNQGKSARDIVFDLPMKGKPLPYTKTEKYRFSGDFGSTEDIRGGMGLEGLMALRKFVEEGGTLITTGNASAVPVQFGLVDDITTSAPPKDFYAPGPIVSAKVLKPESPIFYGYQGDMTDAKMPVRWADNTLYALPDRLKGQVLMQFPGGKAGVMSGFMREAEAVKDRAAIINVPQGNGRILMFATNPIWRWQNFGEFRMLYNAMLNWKQLGVTDAPPSAPPPVPEGQR
ncbi:M14 family zinc carboxypeptidase [Novosphingobium kaempferiae]|uniref:M14 family zinc carboxypeptidase n=1 Tax=Novosphingobium kaempferiae TaxID=2896849 RepID=UPI001E3DCCB4|nr:M14 family zinc carboxypeptidase [Novosphingobium kaempferiae]